MKRLISAVLLFVTSFTVFAWDGYDSETDSYVEIERGNKVRPGNEIEFYDYGAGEFRTGDVESVRRFGNSVEVEVIDHETGDLRIFDMDD